MEFSIQLNHTIAKEAKIKKEIWSVEDCKKYVEKNSHLPNSQKGISLHKLLQKSKFIVEEKKEVSEYKSAFYYSLYLKSFKNIWNI